MTLLYLDNSATTPIHPEVKDAMMPFLLQEFGNPSSKYYEHATTAKEAVANAREAVAKLLSCKADEIIFTSGSTESNNFIIKGISNQRKDQGRHIITTNIEHPSVLEVCKYLEVIGYELTILEVNKEGRITVEQFEQAIRPTTILISIMFANNEIGTIEPVAEIGKIAKENNILFHTDAVQAFGQVPINVDEMNIDMLSASGHKLNGPKGIGFLYIRKGIKIRSLIHGGAQERRRRAGTENVPGIVGFGKAVELAISTMEERTKKEQELRDYLLTRVLKEVPYTRVNGSRTNRLPNNASFCFQFIEGESLLIMLDMEGICGSSGSACTSGSLDPSHVLLAIGLPHEIAHGSLRLTLGIDTTKEDIDTAIEAIKKIVAQLREMSPLYEDFQKKNNH